MNNVFDIDLNAMDFSDSDLEEMAKVLKFAKKIQDDSDVFKLVMEWSDKDHKQIKSLKDVRRKVQEAEGNG